MYRIVGMGLGVGVESDQPRWALVAFCWYVMSLCHNVSTKYYSHARRSPKNSVQPHQRPLKGIDGRE